MAPIGSSFLMLGPQGITLLTEVALLSRCGLAGGSVTLEVGFEPKARPSGAEQILIVLDKKSRVRSEGVKAEIWEAVQP